MAMAEGSARSGDAATFAAWRFPVTRDDARTLALVYRFGRTSTAFQSLGGGLSHWFAAAGDGVVAYADTGGAWVAAGEPVASEERATDVAAEFIAAAAANGRRVAFFATEGILASSPRFRRTLIGEQPVWDPVAWEEKLRGHRSMREQLRRARAKGVTVEEVPFPTLEHEPTRRAALERIVEQWLAARPMARMGFLVDAEPLRHLEHRLLFVASRDGEPVALLSLAPVPARNGWLFEHLLRGSAAPNGTAETLVDHAMRQLASRGVRWASLGLAPLAGEVAGWLRAAREVSRPFFNFPGLSSFKRKLRPDSWAPIYLAYPAERSMLLALLDGLRAFAGRGIMSFGLRTVLRGPRPLLRALEFALVPWTLALALAPVSPWFPSATVQWSWVAFDVLLIIGLRQLRRRRTRGQVQAGGSAARLAVALAAAVSLDALLTALQAATHTVPILARSGNAPVWMWCVVAVACVAPIATAVMLWGAARRLFRLERSAAAPAALRPLHYDST